ncbi:MAG: hypothetical protein IPO41_14855 [Acidobacteria bacterium]|nr:hypothetical protein [Acidobacteriota bacterium]
MATLSLSVLAGGCNIVKKESKTATLLATKNATQAELVNEINRFARVDSMRAKMDLKFEDNSFAEFGTKEVYREAEGEIVVQRPGKILLKVKVPVIKTDVAQMTSDGQGFRVAILQDGGSGKYKKFVKGTNKADYSPLQKKLSWSLPVCNGGKGAKEKRQCICEHASAAFYRRDDGPTCYGRQCLYAEYDLPGGRRPDRSQEIAASECYAGILSA